MHHIIQDYDRSSSTVNCTNCIATTLPNAPAHTKKKEETKRQIARGDAWHHTRLSSQCPHAITWIKGGKERERLSIEIKRKKKKKVAIYVHILVALHPKQLGNSPMKTTTMINANSYKHRHKAIR